MASSDRLRQYLVVKSDANFLDVYRGMNLESIRKYALDMLRSHGAPVELVSGTGIEVHAAPSIRFTSTPTGASEAEAGPSELVLALDFSSSRIAESFRHFIRDHVLKYGGGSGSPIGGQQTIPLATASQSLGSLETAVFNAGADPVGYSTAAVSGVRDARVFGTRAMAREMLGISGQPPPRLSGLGVNVVIVDRGLNKEAIDRLERDNWGDGFDVAVAHRDGSERQVVKAGLAPLDSHGMMIARNVLDIVPMAKLYDAPLLPPLIAEPRIFASTANATYRAILDKIEQQRRQSGANTPWIIVNAWAIFDRSTEWPPGDYTQNRHFGIEVRRSEALTVTWGHPLNMIIEEAIRSNVDVVFGAGNCGQFSTSLRCGQRDRGPGCSIWGANGHPSVVTVGAVSTDGAWMGYSSEGPAQWSVHRSDALNEVEIKKPDIVAPSQFREDKDASLVNSGTSAAAGLAAGVIAAIRSTKDHHWGPNELAPLDLKDAMIKTARGGGGGWSPRVGHGILHLPGLIEELERRDQGIRIDQA